MPNSERPAERGFMGELLEFAKSILFAGGVFLAITTCAYAQYHIPSGSMIPTLEIGDRVMVSKFAYGYSRFSLPLNVGALMPRAAHRLLERMPERGDVVVFIHPRTGETLIKRLIALPGERVEMRNGQLYLNSLPVDRDDPQHIVRPAQGRSRGLDRAIQFSEMLPNGVVHPIHEMTSHGALDEFGPVTVPEGHVFVMGDNRDNSLDSRWTGLGFVPIENLVGRAETIVFAPSRCRAAVCGERDRWLRPLRD